MHTDCEKCVSTLKRRDCRRVMHRVMNAYQAYATPISAATEAAYPCMNESCVNDDEGCGVDFDDAYLDRINALLEAIARDCLSATEWSFDAEAALDTAITRLHGVQRICYSVGLTSRLAECCDDSRSWGELDGLRFTNLACLNDLSDVEGNSPTPSPSRYSHNSMDTSICPEIGAEAMLPDEVGEILVDRWTDQMHEQLDHVRRDNSEVQVEDPVTPTWQHFERWQHEFQRDIGQRESTCHRSYSEQIRILQDTLNASNNRATRLESDLAETKSTVQSLQDLVLQAQNATDTKLALHSQYWKRICNDLVAEKLDLSKSLAQERGKYHSLKEHIGMHSSNAASTHPSENPTYTRKRSDAGSHDSTDALTHISSPAASRTVIRNDNRLRREATSPTDGHSMNPPSSDGEYSSATSQITTARASFRRYYLANRKKSNLGRK